MLSRSVWFSAPSLRMDGGLESRCVGCVYGADGATCMDYLTARLHENAKETHEKAQSRYS